MKKITGITGHYGSGKTNISVNLALKLSSQNQKVTVVDLDIVNPYFRTADFEELFAQNNITLVKPLYANSNLDIPAINFDLERIASEDGFLIIDVGGDDTGAFALGRYADALLNYKDDFDMLYVINYYRFLTHDANSALKLMYEIETASRLKHTAIINNSNLGSETTASDVEASMTFASQVSQYAGIPIAFTACNADAIHYPSSFEPVKIFVKPIWDS